MDSSDYRMIVRWVMDLLDDGRVPSPVLQDKCRTLMDRAWSRLHPRARSSNETHERTRESE
jgi:hypothetical protein